MDEVYNYFLERNNGSQHNKKRKINNRKIMMSSKKLPIYINNDVKQEVAYINN